MDRVIQPRNDRQRGAVTRGTANVFADLGFPDAGDRQAKLRFAYLLNQLLERCGLSTGGASKVLGVTRAEVSALRHYKLAGLSVDQLIDLLTALTSKPSFARSPSRRARRAR